MSEFYLEKKNRVCTSPNAPKKFEKVSLNSWNCNSSYPSPLPPPKKNFSPDNKNPECGVFCSWPTIQEEDAQIIIFTLELREKGVGTATVSLAIRLLGRPGGSDYLVNYRICSISSRGY